MLRFQRSSGVIFDVSGHSVSELQKTDPVATDAKSHFNSIVITLDIFFPYRDRNLKFPEFSLEFDFFRREILHDQNSVVGI